MRHFWVLRLGENYYLCTSAKAEPPVNFPEMGVNYGIISIDCNSDIYFFFIAFSFKELISIREAVPKEDWLYWIHIELIKKHGGY